MHGKLQMDLEHRAEKKKRLEKLREDALSMKWKSKRKVLVMLSLLMISFSPLETYLHACHVCFQKIKV